MWGSSTTPHTQLLGRVTPWFARDVGFNVCTPPTLLSRRWRVRAHRPAQRHWPLLLQGLLSGPGLRKQGLWPSSPEQAGPRRDRGGGAGQVGRREQPLHQQQAQPERAHCTWHRDRRVLTSPRLRGKRHFPRLLRRPSPERLGNLLRSHSEGAPVQLVLRPPGHGPSEKKRREMGPGCRLAREG